jgi:hypothetical protein
MAQVRVAIFNQEFSPQRVSELEIAASLHGKCIWAARQAGTDQRTEQAAQPCTKPWRPDETDLLHFCTLSSPWVCESKPAQMAFIIMQNTSSLSVVPTGA